MEITVYLPNVAIKLTIISFRDSVLHSIRFLIVGAEEAEAERPLQPKRKGGFVNFNPPLHEEHFLLKQASHSNNYMTSKRQVRWTPPSANTWPSSNYNTTFPVISPQ